MFGSRVVWTALLLTPACGDAVAPGLATTEEATSTSTSAGSSSGDVEEPTTGPGEPVCCGCLCVDPAWSCAAGTCVHADGTASALAPEAGFLAIAPHSFSTFMGDDAEVVHQAPEARMWYAFRPADDRPETRPLAVFFNGGPGYSSAILFGFNTNAVTLDPDIAGAQVVVANAHSWTRFANVLYLDPRRSGYSYDLAPADPEQPSLKFRPEHDAADFVRVLLAFLARHPQIEANPVMLVSESYGGNRSALMLAHLLRPDRLASSKRYRDEGLRDVLLAHYARVFPDEPKLAPGVLARQFGHQVMIQPALTWLTLSNVVPTPDEQQLLALGCIDEPDVAQCDEPEDWSFARARAVIAAVADPVHLGPALGVDVSTIAWMYADERAAGIARGSSDGPDETNLRAMFGELAADDRYYDPASPSNGAWTQSFYGEAYLETIYDVRTLITDAGKDTVVYSPDIPAYLAGFDYIVSSVVHDTQARPGEARPGWLQVKYDGAVLPGAPVREVRFPHYPNAGHMVSHKYGAELASDVCRWYSEDCPIE